jgi:CBS domain-containing protein
MTTDPDDLPGHVKKAAGFLTYHPPFDSLTKAELERVAASLTEQTVLAGETVLFEDGAPGQFLYVVRSGTVELLYKDQVVDVITDGQLFGHPTLLTGLAPQFTARARDRTSLFLIPRDVALDLLSRPEGVVYYAHRVRDMLLRAARTMHAVPDVRSAVVTSVLRRHPVFCEPDTSIGAAAHLMSAEKVTAILVRTRGGLGIVTDSDLRDAVLADGVSRDSPISSIMTTPVRTVPPEMLAREAGIEMMEAGLSHLPVMDAQGQILGVVSADSLMTLDALSPFGLRASLASARDEEELVEAAMRLPDLFVTMLDAHVDAPALTRVVTLLCDTMTVRLLDLAMERHGKPPVAYAWLALGSCARGELTLASDQDNALAYEDADDPAVDAYFERVAVGVNSGLARCGFRLDDSDVLARSKRWRLSRTAWINVFSACLDTWAWKEVMRASISFDFRHVAGDLSIVPPLAEIMRQAPQHGGFLDSLAKTASGIPSPLGFRRRMSGPIDIKKSAMLPIENMARYYALSKGIVAATTDARLVAAHHELGKGRAQIQSVREAFASLSHLRLRHHANAVRMGHTPDDVIDTAVLRPLTRVSLHEALKTVAAAQKQLP